MQLRESMNKYWSNEDDKKVSYITERPVRNSRVENVTRRPALGEVSKRPEDEKSAFSPTPALNRRENRVIERPVQVPERGAQRSTFISDDLNEHWQDQGQFAPPPKFAMPDPPAPRPPVPATLEDGYQVHSEHPGDSYSGGRKRGWLILLIILVALLLIGGGAYIFRAQILDLVGDLFGEEVAWKISPTAAPTATVQAAPAYIEPVQTQIKAQTRAEIESVAGGVEMAPYAVTNRNVVMRAVNPGGGVDFYLFAYDDGRLLGYYEGLTEVLPCTDDIFYIGRSPYLITSRGFPLIDLAAFRRTTGGDVRLFPMINGWAMVSDQNQTMFNFVNKDGNLLSDLWFAKAFAFTAQTTLGYVDTGNVADPEHRYALYLLDIDGESTRLSYAADMDGVLEAVSGVALMANGDMRSLNEDMTLIGHADAAAAYVNCGALVGARSANPVVRAVCGRRAAISLRL